MKFLFDQGTPVPLRNHLLLHTVETVHKRGWSDLKNGGLLARAEAEGFDALFTTDQNFRYQQNLSGRSLGVVVPMTTSWPRIRAHVNLIVHVADNLRTGAYEEISFP